MTTIKRLLWSLIPFELPTDDEDAYLADVLNVWTSLYGETA